jgi:hypothetical protein
LFYRLTTKPSRPDSKNTRLKYNRSTFAQDLLEKGHAIGKMEEIMIIHAKRTGRMLNILETFLIYKETKAKKHINDTDPKKKLNIPDNITTRPLRGIHSPTTEYPVKIVQSCETIHHSTEGTAQKGQKPNPNHRRSEGTFHNIWKTVSSLQQIHIDKNK